MRNVVGGPDGVIARAPDGALIFDMSTIGPETTDALGRQAGARGLAFMNAPVGRVASHADRRFMVGAEETGFMPVKPLLEAMGSAIYHYVGAGTRTKLVNNFLAVASCQFNAEALALSQRFGLDLARTLDVLYSSSAVNGQLKIAWPDKVLADDVAPGFTVDLAHKDLSVILEAANAAPGAHAHGGCGPRRLQLGPRPRLRRAGLFRHGGHPLRTRRHREAAPQALKAAKPTAGRAGTVK